MRGTRLTGQKGEQAALAYLRGQGLRFIEANFQCKGGEIDLILRDGDEVVFVEVRQRADGEHGGALASIGAAKVRRLVRAASFWLLTQPAAACRFDVVAIEDGRLEWLRNAIEV